MAGQVDNRKAPAWARVTTAGAATGLLTGFFGVGGGFVIVPALTLVLGLPMTLAVGTSLLVIALISELRWLPISQPERSTSRSLLLSLAPRSPVSWPDAAPRPGPGPAAPSALCAAARRVAAFVIAKNASG